MRTIITTFVIEEEISDRTAGTVVSKMNISELPVKYSVLKAFAEKDLPTNFKIKSLQSVCDVTDLVEFDEE